MNLVLTWKWNFATCLSFCRNRSQMFFPNRKFPFWYTQNKFQWFWNEVKSKKQTNTKTNKKKGLQLHLVLFCNFFLFPFQFSTFPFSIFLLLYIPFFPCISFPGRSAEISWWKVSGWAFCPPASCLLHHCMKLRIKGEIFCFTHLQWRHNGWASNILSCGILDIYPLRRH